jgi:protein-S-isoprenylcysteine O-methyltransferase Ste14
MSMPSGEPGAARAKKFGPDWPAAAVSLAVGAAFFALWFWLLPPWLGFRVDFARVAPWRWLAAIPSVLGFAVAVRCIWNFGKSGGGTPAPMASPRTLVVVGFYRHVRNPMYLGFFLGWAGLWTIFGRASRLAAEVALIGVAAVAVFVLFYEEPVLRRKFGAEYGEYRRAVPRWLPRLRPWNPG